MAYSTDNDRAFFNCIETANPSEDYIDDYIRYRLQNESNNSFILNTAAELFDYKYIVSFYGNVVSGIKDENPFVMKAISEKLMAAFNRKIIFANLITADATLSSVLTKINASLSLSIPFPNIQGNLNDIEAETLRNLQEAYQTEVSFWLQRNGIVSTEDPGCTTREKKKLYNPETPIYDEDMCFLEKVKFGKHSSLEYHKGVWTRLFKCRLSYLLCDIKQAIETETDCNILNKLYVFYNTIADNVAKHYGNDQSLRDFSKTIPFQDFSYPTSDQLEQIRDLTDALMYKEMSLLTEKTGYCYPVVQMELKFNTDPEAETIQEVDVPFVCSNDSLNDFQFPNGYTNINRARRFFELAAKFGFISKDWKSVGKGCTQKNLLVYFCESVFCKGRCALEKLPAEWIEEKFGIKNVSRMMNDYHNNSSRKPKGAKIIDDLLKMDTVS